jgi:ADP-ribosylglycohydrolase
MIGAICGDVIGSYYEAHCTKDYNFELFCRESCFTDDTVLTAAVCDAILYNQSEVKGLFENNSRAKEYAYRFKLYFHRYPSAGFGKMFQDWAQESTLKKQNSYANGGAMRVVPIGYAYSNLREVLKQAKLSCVYTHNNMEAIKGAQAVASAVFLARNNYSKNEIKTYIEKQFKYNLSEPIEKIQEKFVFDSRASYTVPPAIMAFLQSTSFEDAIRKAVSLGGDADTIACMTGGIAEAYYKSIPKHIEDKCWNALDSELRKTFKMFNEKFPLHEK